MVRKALDALRRGRQHSKAEIDIDNFQIRLKFWSLHADEFIMLTPTAAQALFEDGLRKVEQIKAMLEAERKE